jgi:hypothetical protein
MPVRLRLSWGMKTWKLFFLRVLESFEFAWQVIRYALWLANCYFALVTHDSRLLKDMGFSLKANKRKQGRVGCPERDEQFKYIASQKIRFITAGWPIISIDTKKKELIGEFRNNGRTWRRHAEEVNEQDFPGVARWRAVPFGIYDVGKNEGFVYVGISNDTPEFAVCSIASGGGKKGAAFTQLEASYSFWQLVEEVMVAGHEHGS